MDMALVIIDATMKAKSSIKPEIRRILRHRRERRDENLHLIQPRPEKKTLSSLSPPQLAQRCRRWWGGSGDGGGDGQLSRG